MKLRRFLLRYEPKGIGLEVEDDDGNLEVRHKSLNYDDLKVTTQTDLLALAEELCASEPGLLNANKHRGTLLRLLNRLYQIEAFGGPPSQASEVCSPGSVENGSPLTSKHSQDDAMPCKAASSSADSHFEEGRLVVLVGLRGKLQSYNGELAFVIKACEGKDKYEVDVSSDRTSKRETLKIKGSKHLRAVKPAPQPFTVGTCLVLCNLHSDVELNGCIVTVVECIDQGDSYEVVGAAGHLFFVKSEHAVPVEETGPAPALEKENLETNMASDSPAPILGSLCKSMSSPAFPTIGSSSPSACKSPSACNLDLTEELLGPGSIIELVGLRNHLSYNGQEAKIIGLDRDSGRYQVLMADQSLKKIKRENVRRLAVRRTSSEAGARDRGYSSMIARGLGNASQMLRFGDRGKRKATWGSPSRSPEAATRSSSVG